MEAVSQALTAPRGHLDALRAIQAAIPPAEFWSPKVLGVVPSEVAEAFLDAMVARRPAQRVRLAQARGLRGLAVVERIRAMEGVLRGAPPEAGLIRGLAWSAGLSPEVIGAIEGEELKLEEGSSLTWLPAGLEVLSISAEASALESLPAGLVARYIDVRRCEALKRLPDDLQVHRLNASSSGLESIPAGFQCTGLSIGGCQALKSLPPGLDAETVIAERSALRHIAEDIRVRNLYLEGCKDLKCLPAGLEVQDLEIERTGVESLPEGLRVAWLSIRNCRISSLPRDLRVSGNLLIQGTPLVALSDDEIRAMAPGVTGGIHR